MLKRLVKGRSKRQRRKRRDDRRGTALVAAFHQRQRLAGQRRRQANRALAAARHVKIERWRARKAKNTGSSGLASA